MSIFKDRCSVCGCTDDDPCYHPDHGFCGWANSERTLCTHCADPNIRDNPLTVHCINTVSLKSGVDTEDIMNQIACGEPFEY